MNLHKFKNRSAFASTETPGLSRLEFFTAQALAGMCANPEQSQLTAEHIADWCVHVANATLDHLYDEYQKSLHNQ